MALSQPTTYFHGTKADLKPGDHLRSGFESNFGVRRTSAHVYFSATLEAATWGAELAVGEGPGRIDGVEPTGDFHDDPNLTDRKFPGNPTKSYRTRDPLLIVGEVADWIGHTPQQLADMRAGLDRLKAMGGVVIGD